MPPFPKPDFSFSYSAASEIACLDAHRQLRGVPQKGAGTVLIASWNLANFGQQERRSSDLELIAYIVSWFDVVAIQEVKDNFVHLEELVRILGGGYRYVMSDAAGNSERMAFVYDGAKVKLLEKIGEIGFTPTQLKQVKLAGVKGPFNGFDRSPYFATFAVGRWSFLLANVHLYYGSEKDKKDIDRRALEAYAVAWWATKREKSPYAFTRDIIALGDCNVDKTNPAHPVFKALTSLGLEVPQHSTVMGSNLAGDKEYDQLAFFPGETRNDFTGNTGVFDFDQVIFQTLWNTQGKAKFNSYVRYYISDHRPIWAEFRT